MFRGMVRVVTERERREEDGSYGFTSQAPVVHGGLPWWRCPLWVAATAHVMSARVMVAIREPLLFCQWLAENLT